MGIRQVILSVAPAPGQVVREPTRSRRFRGDMAESAGTVGLGLLLEPLHRVLPAQALQLAPLRREMLRWLERLALSEDAEDDLVLAVNEAANNCIEHAYRPGTVATPSTSGAGPNHTRSSSRSSTTAGGGPRPENRPARPRNYHDAAAHGERRDPSRRRRDAGPAVPGAPRRPLRRSVVRLRTCRGRPRTLPWTSGIRRAPGRRRGPG